MSYESNISLADAAAFLAGGQRVVVTSHAKPDGDAFGSVMALTLAMRAMGWEVEAGFIPPVPPSFSSWQQEHGFVVYRAGVVPGATLSGPADRVVVLDTGAKSQLLPLADWVESQGEMALIVDHHLRGDLTTKYRYIDATAAACAEIVAELIEQLGGVRGDRVLGVAGAKNNSDILAVHGDVVEGLYLGIVSDTGWFRYSNTRVQTHLLAARLLGAGIDQDKVVRSQDECSPAQLRLTELALSRLTYFASGQVAVMGVTAIDFAACRATLDDTEGLIDLPRRVKGVRAVALITEPPADRLGLPGGPVRVSLRSNPGDDAINVSDVASLFGGGGHARASGAKVDLPYREVFEQVSEALVAAASHRGTSRPQVETENP